MRHCSMHIHHPNTLHDFVLGYRTQTHVLYKAFVTTAVIDDGATEENSHLCSNI